MLISDSSGQVYSVSVDASQNLVVEPVTVSAIPDPVYLSDISGRGRIWYLLVVSGVLTGQVATGVDAQPFVELNDNWLLFVTYNGNLRAKQSPPSSDNGLELVVEVFLDDGRERYSMGGIAMQSRFYEPRLLSISGFSRSIPAVPGSFSSGSVSITLDNSGNYFSKKLDGGRFHNRRVDILMGDIDRGESDFRIVFSGLITARDVPTNTFRIEVADSNLNWLSTMVRWRINNQTFPGKPATTPAAMAPFIAGTVARPTGAIPAYLVDPAVGQSKYRYVASVYALKSVTAVYLYKELVAPANYTVSQLTVGGQEYTIIDFATDQRDENRLNENEITFNAIGITDDGTPSGAAITNPVEQVQEFLDKHGVGLTQLQLDKFTAAAALYSTRSIVGGVAIAGEIISLRTVLEYFSESFNLYFYPSRSGQLAISVPNRDVGDTTALFRLVDIEHVIADSFQLESTDELATGIRANSAFNHATGEYEASTTFNDSTQEAAQRNATITDREFRYCRDSSSLVAVVEDKLFFMREERTQGSLRASLATYRQIDVGDLIKLTHFAGIAADGRGYRDKVVFVLDAGIQGGEGDYHAEIRWVDLEETLPPATDFFLDYGVEFAPFYTNLFDDRLEPLGDEPVYHATRGDSGV